MHLDLKPANILIAHDGTLKICDFGMASAVPAPDDFEREGDRDYIAPEVLHFQQYDTPVDIFSLGLTIIETAGNEALPPGGPEWQALRSGDIGVAPVLSTNLSGEFVHRDEDGNALATEVLGDPDDPNSQGSDQQFSNKRLRRNRLDYIRCIRGAELHRPRPGDLVDPPDFMAEGKLEEVVRAMISANPRDRPSASQLLQCAEIRWVVGRRQKPATVFEGLWGPDDSRGAACVPEPQTEHKDWDMEL
jgi:mitosis inhibitor protein kinase SWE1